MEGYRELGSPELSADGSWVAFNAFPGGYYGSDPEIWLAKRDGTELHKLIQGGCPRFSPNCKQMLFFRAKCRKDDNRPPDDEAFGVFRIDVDGKNERRLGPGRWPEWSPDGRKIAYSLDPGIEAWGGSRMFGRIYIAEADGSRPTLMANGDNPRWSHDGKWLAYSYNDPAMLAPTIRIMNLETKEHTLLGYGWYRPNWLPDDSSVVANGIIPGENRALTKGMVQFFVNRKAPWFISTEFNHPLSPCISADGKWLVYIAGPSENEEDQEEKAGEEKP
jgi:Tol biopolymer transport system component